MNAARSRSRSALAKLALLAALAPAPAQAATALPLANPSAEAADAKDASKPAAWSGNAWGAMAATFTWLTGDCADGARCLRVQGSKTGGDGDGKWWSDPVAVPADAQLRLRLQRRHDVPVQLMVYFQDAAGAQSTWVVAAELTPAAAWTATEATLVSPAWAATARVMLVLATSGSADCDAWELATVPKATPKPAKVSLTFDDGWVTAYAYLVPELDKRDLEATHFVISGFMDKPGFGADYIGSKRVKELLAEGHEIGSHTIDHLDMTKVSPKALDENLELSRQALEAFGTSVPGFAWPYGYYNAALAERARKTYSYVRTVEPGLNVPPYDVSKLKGYVVTNTTTVADIEGWVQQAELIEGAWVVLIYHRADPEAPLDSFVTPASFVATLDMLQKRGADIRPMGRFLDVWKAQPLPVEPVWDGGSGRSFDAPGALKSAAESPGPGDGACAATPRHGGRASAGPSAGFGAALLLAALALRRRRVRAQAPAIHPLSR